MRTTAARVSDIDEVEAFWSAHPCDSELASSSDRRQYFEQIERIRYSQQSYIQVLAGFQDFAGKRVLEIGCGVGTDGRQFAKAGAIYTGVNLDRGSTELAREAFTVFGLQGSIRRMNAERLEFADATFDHVYSMGVIHHSTNPQAVVREAFGVLVPGGTLRAMFYNRSSINYRFEIMVLRRALKYVLLPAWSPRVVAQLMGLPERKLMRHREILLTERVSRERWISINTDGPDCPLSRVYSPQEGTEVLANAGFAEVKTFVRFFNKQHYGVLSRLIPNRFAETLGCRWGWHLWIEGVKPLTSDHPDSGRSRYA